MQLGFVQLQEVVPRNVSAWDWCRCEWGYVVPTDACISCTIIYFVIAIFLCEKALYDEHFMMTAIHSHAQVVALHAMASRVTVTWPRFIPF